MAVFDVPKPMARAVSLLSDRTGLSSYDSGARLRAGPPLVVAVLPAAGPAEALAGALAEDGFLPHVLPFSSVERDDQRIAARELSLGEDALEVRAAAGKPARRLPWTKVELIVQGRLHRTTTKVILLDPRPRAKLGFRLQSIEMEQPKETVQRESIEGFLVVFGHGARPIMIREQAIRYEFLGTRRKPSTSANFAELARELKRRAPDARFDDRLQRSQSLGAGVPAPGDTDAPAWRLDVALALLSRWAIRRGGSPYR